MRTSILLLLCGVFLYETKTNAESISACELNCDGLCEPGLACGPSPYELNNKNERFCVCDYGPCCLETSPCETLCHGTCVANEELCEYPKRPYYGDFCYCVGGICCTDVCGVMEDTDELCATVYHGICRDAYAGCQADEVPRNESNLCGGYDCICCKQQTRKEPSDPETGGREDPKFLTPDGNTFHFDGRCTYILMRECENPRQRPWFIVYIEHTSERAVDSRGHQKTYVKGAIIEIDTQDGGKHVIHLTNHGHVKINDGSEVDVNDFEGWEDIGLGLHVQKYKQRLNVTLDGHFTISYNRWENVFVNLGDEMKGKICGLMGNGDGNPDNDFQMIDPQSPSTMIVLDNPNQKEIDMFGDSWVKPGTCPE